MTDQRVLTEHVRRNRALAAIAFRQQGLFTRAQARSVGYSSASIDDKGRRGLWVAVDYGVYRLSATPSSWHQRLLAVCLAGTAVASHRAAAALWNMPGFDRSVVEVTALRHRRRKAPDVLWHESVRLDATDVTEIEGIPVTTACRTLLDLGAVADERTLLIAFDDAERRHLVGRVGLARHLEQFGDRRRGSGRIRRVLAQRPLGEAVRESPLESLFDILVRDHGLPVPTAQFVIRDPGGSFIARVDYAYVDDRLGIEIDGSKYHGGSGQWEQDLDRQNRIMKVRWRLLRFPLSKLRDHPAGVAEMIRDALKIRPASLTPK